MLTCATSAPSSGHSGQLPLRKAEGSPNLCKPEGETGLWSSRQGRWNSRAGLPRGPSSPLILGQHLGLFPEEQDWTREARETVESAQNWRQQQVTRSSRRLHATF